MGFFSGRIRTWTWAAALCLLFASFPASVHAQGTQTGGGQIVQTRGTQDGSEQNSRTGMQTGNEQDSRTVLTTQVKGYPGDIEDGKGEAALPDGTTVTAEAGSLPDGLLLVVESIETGNADYDRIAAYMEGLGTKLRVYDIYFVDSNGQRYEASETVTITISLNGAYQSPAIYYVSPENGASRADSSVKNDRISFRISPDKTVYYVLAEKKSSSGDPGQGGETGGTGGSGEDGDTSDGGPGSGGENSGGTGSAGSTSGAGNTGSNTGDGTNLTLWLLACTGAASVLVLVLAAGKRREKRGHKI